MRPSKIRLTFMSEWGSEAGILQYQFDPSVLGLYHVPKIFHFILGFIVSMAVCCPEPVWGRTV